MGSQIKESFKAWFVKQNQISKNGLRNKYSTYLCMPVNYATKGQVQNLLMVHKGGVRDGNLTCSIGIPCLQWRGERCRLLPFLWWTETGNPLSSRFMTSHRGSWHFAEHWLHCSTHITLPTSLCNAEDDFETHFHLWEIISCVRELTSQVCYFASPTFTNFTVSYWTLQ